MSGTTVIERLQADIKTALKAGDKNRTGVLRLLLSAVKQKKIDDGADVDDAMLLAIVEKMIKQRNDSIRHYETGGRDDLAAQEKSEIALLQEFLPPQLSEDEIAAIVDEVIVNSGDKLGIKNMGAVMGALKPRLTGQADMQTVSRIVKAKLSG